MEPTAEHIANRRKVIRALKRSKRQCVGFEFGAKGSCCAIGVAIRTLLGIRDDHQLVAYENDDRNAWSDVNRLLGFHDTDREMEFLWRANDQRELTLPEIGAECEKRWL